MRNCGLKRRQRVEDLLGIHGGYLTEGECKGACLAKFLGRRRLSFLNMPVLVANVQGCGYLATGRESVNGEIGVTNNMARSTLDKGHVNGRMRHILIPPPQSDPLILLLRVVAPRKCAM